MPAHTRPETSEQQVVVAAEVSRDLLRRHARLLRELARIAEEMPEEDGR